MRTSFAVASGLLAGVVLMWSTPAEAHGGVGWSVTVNSGMPAYSGYYQPYSPPGVVVYPQAAYPYGAPPSAFVPPPTVYYTPPPPVVYPYYPRPSASFNIYSTPSYSYRQQPRWQHDNRGWNRWDRHR